MAKSKEKINGQGTKKVNKKSRTKIMKTVQETIPYVNTFENGIIETEPCVFTRAYLLNDVNFKISNEEDQERIDEHYQELLNTIDSESQMQIVIYNRSIDKSHVHEKILLPPRRDNLNYLREEYNQMLIDKMSEGRNNIQKEIYLVISIEADNIEMANDEFNRLNTPLSAAIKKVNNAESAPMKILERLDVLYDILNMGTDVPLNQRVEINGKTINTFDLKALKKQGITTKDLIAPPSMEFKKDYFMMGDKYARAVFLDNLPSFMKSDVLTDLAEVGFNILLSTIYKNIRQDKAFKMLRNQMVNINANVVEAQKRASRSGYSADLISPELLRSKEQADSLIEDLSSRNQKLFLVTITAVIFADSLDELEKNTKTLSMVANRHLCQIKKFNYQQQDAFATTLPLCTSRVFVDRMLTTESAAIFIPFSAQEMTQENGMYYGLNAVSKNLILFNRINSPNGNGVILGTPGSGKSFASKREITNVLLNTDDEIFIIDPEREYRVMAELLGGQVIEISNGSKSHVNPLDMDIDYDGDGDPISFKSDYIISLCEMIVGGHYGLNPLEGSIIDRCVRQLYQPYLEHLQEENLRGNTITKDVNAAPTLVDLYDLLSSQPEPEAQNIALALERYSVGSLNTFSYHTNVDTKSRFVVYDTKDIGTGMKDMGVHVCLNDVWNRMIDNKKKGIRTWFYIDEFYLLLQTEASAKFLQQIWKRARKWNGFPCGITQNVEDLLKSDEGRTIISTSDFILLLNQAPLDRAELAHLLNISPTQLSYITNSDPGQGLIYSGSSSMIPFIDKFPQDTQLYKAMTTKPSETLDRAV